MRKPTWQRHLQPHQVRKHQLSIGGASSSEPRGPRVRRTPPAGPSRRKNQSLGHSHREQAHTSCSSPATRSPGSWGPGTPLAAHSHIAMSQRPPGELQSPLY